MLLAQVRLVPGIRRALMVARVETRTDRVADNSLAVIHQPARIRMAAQAELPVATEDQRPRVLVLRSVQLRLVVQPV